MSEEMKNMSDEELLAAYYAALYEEDKTAQPSLIKKYFLYYRFRLKKIRQGVKPRYFFIPASVMMAIFLYFIFQDLPQESSRAKGQAGLSHTLILKVLDAQGGMKELVPGVKVKSGDNILFALKGKTSGYLYLSIIIDKKSVVFFPEKSSPYLFSVEENNVPLKTRQGIVSYRIEAKNGENVTFCSLLLSSPEEKTNLPGNCQEIKIEP